MTRNVLIAAALAGFTSLTLGCSSPDGGSLDGRDSNGSNDPSGNGNGNGNGGPNGDGVDPNGNGVDPSTTPPDVVKACKEAARPYKGFGGVALHESRTPGVAGDDRARVKPYSSLTGEYTRVLGAAPAILAQSAQTFGEAPARWFVEPAAGAVSIFTGYRVAFAGALTYTAKDAKWGVAPTAATAATECAAFERKAWSRTPVPAEIDACVQVAVTSTATETDARRRWAYALATVLTAAEFTTY
jgi:hypothetical protein